MKISINHTCGHKTVVEGVDASTKAWVKHYTTQECFECNPTVSVYRLCEHVEQVARGFFSPRALETSAMQMCTECNKKR